MARLGELLVAAGLLTIEQVEQALRAQVMWGGRLGTNIIELGYVDLDTLSKTLGRQHRLPAALARHFEKGVRTLQDSLSADVAERFSAIPLVRGGPNKDQIVIATVAPLEPRALAIIADELAVEPTQLVPAIAAELRIRYHLERVYKIPRGSRFLRSRGKTIPPFPQFEIAPVAPEESDHDLQLPTDTAELPVAPRPTTGPLADPAPPPSIAQPDPPVAGIAADELAIPPAAELPAISLELEPDPEPAPVLELEPEAAHDGYAAMIDDLSTLVILEDDELAVPAAPVEDEPSGRERRRYVRTINDAPATDSERQALGRIAIRRVKVSTPPNAGATLGEATRAIRRATDRDRVAELVIDTISRFVTACEAAIILVVRGDVAISWKAFSRSGASLVEIAVPLDQPGLVPRVVQRNATLRSPASDLGPIDQLLMVTLGQTSGDLVLVPVSIGGQVMCAIALVTAANAQVNSAESVAVAAGAAFARLMRDASR